MGTESRDSRAVAWEHGVLTVESLGGMLGPTLFVLPDGRQVAPFQVAPWAHETDGDELPGILKRLRGEWPCVPFGVDADRPAQGAWPESQAAGTVDPGPHGFSSNNEWQFGAVDATGVAMSIAYPEAHPIASLERRVMPDPERAAIDFELTINVRQDCQLPIGLHPCFRLPLKPGAMRIEVDGGVAGATLPGEIDGDSLFARDQYAPRWNEIRLRDGGVLDVSRVPLEQDAEDLVQLFNMPGYGALWNTVEGYRVKLSWNKAHYPSALLWFSNRGRQQAPWNGRHLALGLEPICAAFDLGPQISTSPNPISARGIPTFRSFTAGERFITRYRVEVEPAEIL